MSVHKNPDLGPLTTLQVGGPSHAFRTFYDEKTLRNALRFADDNGLPVFLLGGGSNVVISESGFPGLVLHPEFLSPDAGQRDRGQTDMALVSFVAGVDWDKAVDYCVRRDLAGIECLAGIPGQVGGTPVQNVGAYGQEVADTIVSVEAYDRQTRQVARLEKADCRFAYRRSRFNHEEPGRWIILAVTFALRVGGKPTLSYADLKQYFGEGATPSLAEVATAVRTIRARKGMVLDPTDRDTCSAGSFFKNPTLTQERFASIRELATARAIEKMPAYPQPDGTVKLSAAFLMEKAGLQRGQTFAAGRVALSTKHVLALTNRGGATGEDIAATARLIQNQVEDAWGLLLAPEPVFVGFTEPGLLPRSATVAVTEKKR